MVKIWIAKVLNPIQVVVHSIKDKTRIFRNNCLTKQHYSNITPSLFPFMPALICILQHRIYGTGKLLFMYIKNHGFFGAYLFSKIPLKIRFSQENFCESPLGVSLQPTRPIWQLWRFGPLSCSFPAHSFFLCPIFPILPV